MEDGGSLLSCLRKEPWSLETADLGGGNANYHTTNSHYD